VLLQTVAEAVLAPEAPADPAPAVVSVFALSSLVRGQGHVCIEQLEQKLHSAALGLSQAEREFLEEFGEGKGEDLELDLELDLDDA